MTSLFDRNDMATDERIQMNVVVAMARIVPMGMDFWASRRSPDRLEPAMMPGDKSDNILDHLLFQA